MKDDLFKVLIVLVIVGLSVVVFVTLDFNPYDDIATELKKPLELKNWHYFLPLFLWVCGDLSASYRRNLKR